MSAWMPIATALACSSRARSKIRSIQTSSAWVRPLTSSIWELVCDWPNQGSQSLLEPGTLRAPISNCDWLHITFST